MNFIHYSFYMRKRHLQKQVKNVDVFDLVKILIFNQALIRHIKGLNDNEKVNLSLENLEESIYYQPLMDAMKGQESVVRLQRIVMNQDEKNLMEKLKEDYKIRLTKLYILEAVIKNLNVSDFSLCIELYERFKVMKELIGENYTKTIMKNVFVILTLKILAVVNYIFSSKKEHNKICYDLLIKIFENFYGQDFITPALLCQIEKTTNEVAENIEDKDLSLNLKKKLKEFKTLHSNGSLLSSEINKTSDLNVTKSRIAVKMESILETVDKIMECNETFLNTYEHDIVWTIKTYIDEKYFSQRYEKFVTWAGDINKKTYYTNADLQNKRIYEISHSNYEDYCSIMNNEKSN